VIDGMNWSGMVTVFKKEGMRFVKVSVQTVLTPILTALLYLLVFGQVLRDKPEVYTGVPYLAFLVPGLVMMSLIQNAFANSASSLIQSKISGNLIFLLLAPLSSLELYLAFVTAAIVRGVMVGIGVYLAASFFIPIPLAHPEVGLAFAVLGGGVLGGLGLIAGIVADKFEHMAAFQNFLILPLSFLSGVFYSIHTLPPFWSELSHANPFFYLIDGFRFGLLGASDMPPAISLAVVTLAFLMTAGVAIYLLAIGYKIRD